MEARGICCRRLFNALIAVCWAIGPLVTWQSPSWWRWGKGRSAPLTPLLSGNMAFEVRAAAFAQLNIALAKLDDEQAVQLEVQQRLWPRCGRTTPAAPMEVTDTFEDHHGLLR